ncbi:putative non-specific serine/threonine protein kinase [Helianthus annuus]|nr:putative non-specific serine/threonine protein kinase [Helianthus annuus]
MANTIYHEHFTNPIIFFIASVLVLESFTTTTALVWSNTQPPTSPGHRTGKCTEKERQALLHFKSYIHYDPRGLLTTWTPGEEEKAATNDCCYWSGVTCNNHSRVTSLELSDGFLEGKISPSLLNFSYLNYLDLSSNWFNGTIPMFIGSMTQLRYLYLGWNDFSGIIPSELGNLTNLQELSLESLSSCTVENLDWLSHLSQLDNLVMSGRIPSGTQLQTFEPSRYIGNAGLCGLPLSKYCPGDKELEGPPITREHVGDGEDVDDLQRWYYVGGATGFVAGFWMVCIALLVNRRGRHAFFHFMNSLENWVYVKVMVFTARLRRVSHP